MSFYIEEFRDGGWVYTSRRLTAERTTATLFAMDTDLPPACRRIVDEHGTPILYGRHPMPAPAPEPDIKPWWSVYWDDTAPIMGRYPDERSAVEPARSLARGGAQYVVAKVTPVLVVGFVERRVGEAVSAT